MSLRLLRFSCDTGRTCPQIGVTDEATYAIQGYTITAERLAALGVDVPDGVVVVEFPQDLLPELTEASPCVRPTGEGTILAWGPPLGDAQTPVTLKVPDGEAVIELPLTALPTLLMNQQQLEEFINAHFTSELFRLEARQHYAVSSDGDDLAAYVEGWPGPDMARKGPWLDVIRDEVARGLHTYRVHIVNGKPTPYERFEFEWGFTLNTQAGEHIRILDLAEGPRPEGLVDEDFWFIAGRDGQPDRAVRMIYNDEGGFLHAEEVPAADIDRYRQARAAAWAAAIPFDTYWNAHPQYWRDRRPTA